MRRLLMYSVLLLLPAVELMAQQQSAPVPPEQETDLLDVIRAWRKKPPPPPAQAGKKMIIASPVIGSNPSAGFVFGAAAQMAFYRGDPSTTRISSGAASLTLSTKEQLVFNVRFHSFSEIYTFVFAVVLPALHTRELEPFALFMFCGILPWTWFSSSLSESSNSLMSGRQPDQEGAVPGRDPAARQRAGEHGALLPRPADPGRLPGLLPAVARRVGPAVVSGDRARAARASPPALALFSRR